MFLIFEFCAEVFYFLNSVFKLYSHNDANRFVNLVKHLREIIMRSNLVRMRIRPMFFDLQTSLTIFSFGRFISEIFLIFDISFYSSRGNFLWSRLESHIYWFLGTLFIKTFLCLFWSVSCFSSFISLLLFLKTRESYNWANYKHFSETKFFLNKWQ